jgi:general secretion pathway protein I
MLARLRDFTRLHGAQNASEAKTRCSGVAVTLRTTVLPQNLTPACIPRARAYRRCALASCAGFTLIEVVVALALVAISLMAIGAVATTSARGTRSLEQHLALVETTRTVAATLPKDDQVSLDGLSGEILGHRWRISVAPFVGGGISQNPDSPWIPQTVVVRVRSPSGAVYGFETVRLQRRPVQ